MRSQRQKFIGASREHGVNGDENTFRKAPSQDRHRPVSKAKKGAKKAKR